MMPIIGVVVPALAAGGGVPAVADFLCTQIERSGRFRLRLFSLATSSRDECSLRFSSPSTWTQRPNSRTDIWRGREFTHFGAFGSEFEFRRVAPSSALMHAAEQCDLLQFVSGSPAPALTLKGCSKPVVLQVATRAVVERRKQLQDVSTSLGVWRAAMTRIIDRYDDLALQMVDAVMVENRWMLDYARKVVGNRDVSVQNAPPGVDCSYFVPSRLRASRLSNDPYFLFVGRLSDPRKNVTLLCRAYSQLCAQQANPPRLVLAGFGSLPATAMAALHGPQVRERVTVITAPTTEVLRDLYQDATCLAVPSDEEGFGVVILEAMACGVPVIATRCGGPEEIITNGQDGFLVPLDNAQEMALHLRLLCGNSLNQRMGEAAHQAVLARYSAEAAFAPFLQTYERLLS